MQHAGVVKAKRSLPDLRQAQMGTHHASDCPTQMPDFYEPFRPSASKQEQRRNIKLAADDVDNLLISEFIHTQTINLYESIIF